MNSQNLTLNFQPLIPLTNPAAARGELIPAWDFLSAKVSPAAGLGIYDLQLQNPSGEPIHLIGSLSIPALNAELEANPGPYRTNSLFHSGAAPLFPLANRLRGTELRPEVIVADVESARVTVPANRAYGKDGKRCHLHGLIFDAKAIDVVTENARDEVSVTGQFTNPFYGFWVGDGMWSATVKLSRNVCRYDMTFENTSDVHIPVGAGAHPYFKIPSGDFRNVALYIPGKNLVEIDNYTNVFPTGKIIPVSNTENLNLNFNDPAGRALDGQYLDNCFVDLTRDEKGFAFAEIFDRKMGIKIKVSATNENVIGIQAYAPKNSATVAIELVTHLPDPRKEVWGKQETGMKTLAPGERFHYGYQIEVLPG